MGRMTRAASDPASRRARFADRRRRAVLGVVLWLHAVVGGQRERGATRIELAQDNRPSSVESVRHRRAGRVLVLDVVGGREIHDVGPIGFEQLDAGGKDELAQLGAVDRRQRHADEVEHVVDAVAPRASPDRPSRPRSRSSPRRPNRSPSPSSRRSLSLAVTTATVRPAARTPRRRCRCAAGSGRSS